MLSRLPTAEVVLRKGGEGMEGMEWMEWKQDEWNGTGWMEMDMK